MAEVRFVVIAKDRLHAYKEAQAVLEAADIMILNPVRLQEPVAEGYSGYLISAAIHDLSRYVLKEKEE